jgi:hypothetical protein
MAETSASPIVEHQEVLAALAEHRAQWKIIDDEWGALVDKIDLIEREIRDTPGRATSSRLDVLLGRIAPIEDPLPALRAKLEESQSQCDAALERRVVAERDIAFLEQTAAQKRFLIEQDVAARCDRDPVPDELIALLGRQVAEALVTAGCIQAIGVHRLRGRDSAFALIGRLQGIGSSFSLPKVDETPIVEMREAVARMHEDPDAILPKIHSGAP